MYPLVKLLLNSVMGLPKPEKFNTNILLTLFFKHTPTHIPLCQKKTKNLNWPIFLTTFQKSSIEVENGIICILNLTFLFRNWSHRQAISSVAYPKDT